MLYFLFGFTVAIGECRGFNFNVSFAMFMFSHLPMFFKCCSFLNSFFAIFSSLLALRLYLMYICVFNSFYYSFSLILLFFLFTSFAFKNCIKFFFTLPFSVFLNSVFYFLFFPVFFLFDPFTRKDQ